MTLPAQGTLWSSSRNNVAEVTTNGLVTAVARGVATIQALNEGVQATFTINVTISNDSDNDGLPDDYEIAFGMNPNDPSDAALDFDADGLTNAQEFQAGTNPRLPDTDDDGVIDGEEVRIGTNPLKTDTDSDELADGQEIRRGFNPLSNDTDRDGIPDGLELTLGLNPLVTDATTRVEGRVLDTNGAPVAGVNVAVFGVMTARTDESGAFSRPNVPASLGPIQATAEVVRAGRVYDATSMAVPAVPGGVTDLRNLSLRLNSGNVVGTVTDSSDAVVADALVTVSNGRDTRTAKTDANGFYRVPNMTAGNLVVTVRDPKTGLRGPGQGTLGLNQSTVVNVRLGPFGTVAGTVYARDGVTAVGAGVPVRISGRINLTVSTDALGKYRFEFVPPGTFAVDATDSIGNHGRASGEILATSQVIVSDISFLGRGAVMGLVLSGGQPVSNAAVTLSSLGVFGGGSSTASDGAGRFAFSNLFAGPFFITAQIPTTRLAGFVTNAIEFDGQVVSNNVLLAASGTITGTVFRADGTTVVANAEVTLLRVAFGISQTGLRATTDASGKFGFSLIPLGDYLIDVVDPGTGDKGRGGGVGLTFQNQVATGNITLLGQGSLTVTVRDGAGAGVRGVQVTLFTSSSFFSTSFSAISDSAGAAQFDLVQAGPITLQAKDPNTGLQGRTNGTVGVGMHTNLVLRLQAAGTIAGRVFRPDGTTPAPGVNMFLSGGFVGDFTFATRQQSTGPDGTFRFEHCPLGFYTLTAAARGVNGVSGLVLTNHGQQITTNLTLPGAGTVTGIVRQSDSSPAADVGVSIISQGASGGDGRTDVNGRYTIANVPLGPFSAICSFNPTFLQQMSAYFGSATGQIQTNGEIVTADIQLNANLTFDIGSLFDGNNVPYDFRSDGAVRSGVFNVFGFPQVERGAARLELISSSGSTNTFAGRMPAALGMGGREAAITQTNLAGLDVTRRTFVPRDGYFARYLEVLSNRTPSAITVEVRLTSNFRYTFTPTLVEPRIITTSSGDALLSVSNTPARDRWVVIDDNSDADPFLNGTLPAVTHVFDGTNGQRQAASATFTLDPADNLGFGKLVERWTNITVQPGANVKILHFVVQQITRAGAQASAARLSQIPPEALTGLTPSDLSSVQNFALPANGISSVPPLVGLTGSINGLVLSGDNATPIDSATVNFRSTNVFFGRTYSSRADGAGRFGVLNFLQSGNGVVPLNGFTLMATHPVLGSTSAVAVGTFAPGAVVATQNIVFTGLGVLTGTVRRHSNVVASAGTVRITGEPLPGPLAVGIAPNGVYGMNALMPDVYALFAELPTTQGSPLRGVSSAPIVAGQRTTADIVIQETGTLIGTLRRTNGSAAVNLRVQLRGINDLTRSVFTDTGGRFTFGDVPSGPVSLEAFEPANNSAAHSEAAVLTDQTVVQDLFLTSDGAVTGTVLASGGQPFAGAQVTLTVGTTVLNSTASSNGVYRFPVVPLGQMTVVARDAGTGFRGFTNGLLAVARQTLNLNVYAAAVGSVSGTVFRPDGTTPVPGASVSAFGGALSTVADGVGRYFLDFVPVGSFTVNATHPLTGEAGSAAALVASNSASAVANIVLGPVVTITGPTLAEGNVGTREALFHLTLSSASIQTGTVRYFTSNGTAVALSDFVPTNALVNFPPGVTNRSVAVRVMGDTALESNETFSVVLANATNLTLAVAQATGVITNDDKLPGRVDHFEWAPIPGPQLDHVPFAVTVTARDASNALATNFTGPADLSATIGGGPFSGTLLGSPAFNSVSPTNAFAVQVANSFTPSNDIIVTHLVHYFGTKVTISHDTSNQVLVSQGVISTPGTWIETPLQQPLLLARGQGYRISALLPAGALGYRRLGLANSFPHGTLGDTLMDGQIAQNPAFYGWWMVDLRYSPITSVTVAMTPTNTGTFSNGVWTGEVAILAPVTNVVLAADDRDGHTGLANGIDVQYGNDLLISVQASPEPVPIGGTLFYIITVTNTGPAIATNVVVTNLLPNGFRFLSANGTLGTCSFANGAVTCTMPAVARGAIALVGIAVRPEAVQTDFVPSIGTYRERPVTNVVGVTRAGPDGHLLNNVAQAVTTVLRPTMTISDTTVREGNGESRAAVFDVSISYPTPEEVSFSYATYNFNSFPPTTATATPQVDHVVTYGNVTFAPGETNRSVLVPIIGDSIIEPPETIFLFLSPGFAVRLVKTNGVATILDDDGLPDQIDHFDWATISSPQFVNDPFAVTLTAKNAAGGTVSNFAGQASLSGMTPILGSTNLLLKNDPHFSTGSFGFDSSLGYSFIPKTNMLVTHLRRYFGDSVSIWSSNGLLLARQSFAGPPATWSEAALPAPLVLLADRGYRISTHAPAGSLFYFRSFGFDFPHGIIEAGYRGSFDGFPEQFEGSPRYMVGFKYAVGALPAVPVSPASTTAFTNGVWTGLLAVGVPATNVVLRAGDGDGSVGEANPITVQLHNDVAVSAAAAPALADIRSNLIYTITVTNTGPAAATGVMVTNILPAEANLVSVAISQGSSSISGRTITGSLGTLAAAGSATLTITCKPAMDQIVLTNLAVIGRAEADAFSSNNAVSIQTPVRAFGASVAVVGSQSDVTRQEDVRTKIEASGFFATVSFRQVQNQMPVPSLSELQAYGAVLVYVSNPLNNPQALGDVLADYVDAGFGVVVMPDGFDTSFGLKGRLISQNYLPFTQGNFASQENMILIPDELQHPLLEGVRSFNGGLSFHERLALNPGATLVAHWSNGQPLIGAKSSAAGRTVGLNFFPLSSDIAGGFWDARTDGGRLMANALRWALPNVAPLLPNDLALSLTQLPANLPVGGTLTYTLVVTNSGPSSANGVVLSNVLPTGVEVTSLTSSQGTVSHNDGIVSGNLGILPGGTQATITIAVRALQSGSLTNFASIVRTDNDAYLRNNRATSIAIVTLPVVTAANATAVTEGNVGTTNAIFAVTLSFPSPHIVSIPFQIQENTARAGSDYIATNGTLVFAPGETNKFLPVVVLADNISEGQESFSLRLLGATNATVLNAPATATILDDDPLPVVSISDASVVEGDSGTTAAVFNLSLTPASGGSVNVSCALSNGTATVGADVISNFISVSFTPGVTNQTVVVQVVGEYVPESDETFTVHILNFNGAMLGRSVAVGTILNDDGLPGRLHHFDWALIPSPQILNAPFPVTITARDSFGAAVNTFAGPLTINDGYPTAKTNSFFKDRPHNDSFSTVAELTVGYAFMPLTELVVTHVRNYYGDKVSIWTDAGELVVSQVVVNSPTVWRETPLPAPVTLHANTRYRIGLHKPPPGLNYTGGPGELLPEISLGQSYLSVGDLFPTGANFAAPMVDIKYIFQLSPRFSPAATGQFTNGVWAGDITALALTNDVRLGVDDLLGHSGLANPITILTRHDLTVAAGPNPVAVGATLFVFITIRNQGTNPATGVTITNVLPAGVNLLSVTPSQGTFVNAGRLVTCNVGTLAANAMASVSLLLRPTAEGTLTNVTSAGRNELSPDAGHVVTTIVRVETNTHAVGYFTDGNETTTAPASVISRVGLIPIHIPDIASFDLTSIRILFLNDFQLPPSVALQQRLPAIESWVRAGGVLVIHNRYGGNVPYFHSLLSGAIASPENVFYMLVTPPGDTLVTTGPFGTLIDFDVEGHLSVTVPYETKVIETGSLSAGARRILHAGVDESAAAFSYSLGQGHIYYSAIPLDYYLELPDARAATNIYAPNVVVYAQSLMSASNIVVPRNVQFVLGPGTSSATNGGFQFEIGGLSGHGEVVISVSSDLLLWQPVFTNQPASGTLRFFDPGAAARPFRFYRVEER